MTPKQLASAGEALYGAQWQTQLARAIGVSDRHIRRLLHGDQPIRDELQAKIVALLVKRGAAIDRIGRRLTA